MAGKAELGMVGLGVMGRNLLLNMADHGFEVAGYDLDAAKVKALLGEGEAADGEVTAAGEAKAFVALLEKPRVVMMLVPAGRPVDAVIESLSPLLEKGDLIIDGGNSHFTDTDRRAKALAKKGLHFFGMGVSGGEEGARHGPSMMPGGPKEAYERVRPLLEACSAHVGDDPCVAHLGPGAAGHYVKMVHNGIEYGLMQLIAETYDLMHRGAGLGNDRLAEIYGAWNEGDLAGFLVEITAHIFTKDDDQTGKRLVDVILDVARQKGTGMWTSQDALALGVPAPTIDVAVAQRNISAFEDERRAARETLSGPKPTYDGDADALVKTLEDALHAAMIVTYAQGMSQLAHASEHYGYGLDLETVSRIWRGGCIIRAALLEQMRKAYKAKPGLTNLLLDPALGKKVAGLQGALREAVQTATRLGIPAPAMMTALAYYDSLRAEHLPANLVQAQRDLFGAHTYERVDEKGTFHTQW